MEPACIVDGCLKPQKKYGKCWAHYEAQLREAKGPCTVEGCTRNARSKGLCNVHYRRDLQSQKPLCTVENCGRPIVSGDLCDTHRLRLQHHGHLGFTRPEDWGAKTAHPMYAMWNSWRRSGVVDAWRDFWTFVAGVGAKPSQLHVIRRHDKSKPLGPDNFSWVERVASSIHTKEYAKAWHQANKRKSRDYGLKKFYGITIDQYEKMEREQSGVCAICSRPERTVDRHSQAPRRLAVDHDHSTGAVRGLLCGDCNKGLGHFADSQEMLGLAIAYLHKHTL